MTKKRKCRFCSNKVGVIQKYNLNMCWRCFKENAVQLGFKKYL